MPSRDSDPRELDNRYADPAYQQTFEQLKLTLTSLRATLGDDEP